MTIWGEMGNMGQTFYADSKLQRVQTENLKDMQLSLYVQPTIVHGPCKLYPVPLVERGMALFAVFNVFSLIREKNTMGLT